MLSFVLLIALTAAVAGALHGRLRKHPVVTVLLAALGGDALFQVYARLQMGYFDPFWEIAAVVSLAITVPTAVVVVLGLRYWERRRGEETIEKK